jgi:hypothetical protein
MIYFRNYFASLSPLCFHYFSMVLLNSELQWPCWPRIRHSGSPPPSFHSISFYFRINFAPYILLLPYYFGMILLNRRVASATLRRLPGTSCECYAPGADCPSAVMCLASPAGHDARSCQSLGQRAPVFPRRHGRAPSSGRRWRFHCGRFESANVVSADTEAAP